EALEVAWLHDQPALFTQLVGAQRALADLDAFGQQLLVMADTAEVRLLLRQCGEDQRQPRGFRVMLGDRPVDLAEETVAVAIDLRLLAAAAGLDLHGVAALAGAAVALDEAALALVGHIAAQ